MVCVAILHADQVKGRRLLGHANRSAGIVPDLAICFNQPNGAGFNFKFQAMALFWLPLFESGRW